MILSIAGGSDLLHKTQHSFFQKRESEINRVSLVLSEEGREGGREGGIKIFDDRHRTWNSV